MILNNGEEIDDVIRRSGIRIRRGTNAENDKLERDGGPVSPIQGVPHQVAQDFLRGLDDIQNGRIVGCDAVLLEGRRLLAKYQEKKRWKMKPPS